MRNFLSSVMFGCAYVVGLLAAIAWGAFIWGFNWGHFGSRSWGLGAMALGFGSIFAFLIGFFLIGVLHSILFPEDRI